jgi:hypothetical protein
MDGADQLRRDGLLGQSVHLAGQRLRAAAVDEPEPEPEAEEDNARAAEIAGLATGIREMVPCPALPLRTPLAAQTRCRDPATEHRSRRR